MAIDTFPTLSRGPSRPHTLDFVGASDLVSKTESGGRLARRRFTRDYRKWKVDYKGLNAADYQTMETFIQSHGTAIPFMFTIPTTDEVVRVLFEEKPKLNSGSTVSFSMNIVEV